MSLLISTNLTTSYRMTIQTPSAHFYPPSDSVWGDRRRRGSIKRVLGGRHPFFSKRLRRMAVDVGRQSLPLPNDLFSLHLSAD